MEGAEDSAEGADVGALLASAAACASCDDAMAEPLVALERLAASHELRDHLAPWPSASYNLCAALATLLRRVWANDRGALASAGGRSVGAAGGNVAMGSSKPASAAAGAAAPPAGSAGELSRQLCVVLSAALATPEFAAAGAAAAAEAEAALDEASERQTTLCTPRRGALRMPPVRKVRRQPPRGERDDPPSSSSDARMRWCGGVRAARGWSHSVFENKQQTQKSAFISRRVRLSFSHVRLTSR